MPELAATKTAIACDDLDAALHAAWHDKFGTTPPANAVEVLMSQSALETGAWVECRAFNLGNVKSPPGADGDWCFFTTKEDLTQAACDRVVAASTPGAPAVRLTPTSVLLEPHHPGCRFRAFSSLADGARWYLDFLAAHETTAWPAVLAGDPFAFVHALKLHGYFTAPEPEYLAGVCRFFDAYGTPTLNTIDAVNEALTSLGYAWSNGNPLTVAQSVTALQRATGLVVDGTPGSMTRAKLRVMLAAQAANA